MVSPNEEADHGNGDTRPGDKGVAEDGFARERRNDFADHTHGRQNHDVHGRVRVEPEQVLEEDGISAEHRVKEAKMKHALEAGEQQGNRNYRGSEDEDNAGGVVGPNEKRQAEPGHPRRAHGVNGDDEIQASQDGREAVDENPITAGVTAELE